MANNEEKHGIIKTIINNKGYFLIYLFVILVLTFSTLYLFGLVPTELKTIISREPGQDYKGNQVGELPLSIKITAINVDSQIYNPATTSIDVLNTYLLKGAVRYPGSGLLGGSGNVFLFGHSTGFKFVNNQAYKTFNHIQDLKSGDLISVFSDKNEYTYKVLSVKMVNADEELVEFNTKSKILTLSTCNNFGEKSDRYVVEAEYVFRNSIRN